MVRQQLKDDWSSVGIPSNVRMASDCYIETSHVFHRFKSNSDPAVDMAKGSSVYLGTVFDIGPKSIVILGECTMLNAAHLIIEGKLEIGHHVLVSWGVVIMDCYRIASCRKARHQSMRLNPLHTEDSRIEPVTICDAVWIGFNSTILPGVVIGENSIVAANSVVFESVPPNCVVAGNPKKEILFAQLIRISTTTI